MNSRLVVVGLLLTPLLLSACPIDERTLTTSAGSAGRSIAEGSAGSDNAAAPNAAGTDSGGDAAGGDGGQSSSPSWVDGCPDLDADGVSDCTETAVKNFAFDADVSEWVTETGATLTWSAQDLLSQAGSGSALVTSADVLDAGGNSFVSADQCITVSEGQLIDLFANAYIDPGQVIGQAGLSLWFFSDAACPVGDSVVEAFETAGATTTKTLLTLQGSKAVPPGALSALVRLGVSKPFQARAFSVHFDNVLVHVH